MAKGSKGESNSNDPKASTDSSTTLEDEDPKGETRFPSLELLHSFKITPFCSSFMELSFHTCSLSDITTPVQLLCQYTIVCNHFLNNTQRETRFICRLVICKVESFMLHPICGFVASLKDCFADSWYGEHAPIWHQNWPQRFFRVRFVANSAFCSEQMIPNLTQRRDWISLGGRVNNTEQLILLKFHLFCF